MLQVNAHFPEHFSFLLLHFWWEKSIIFTVFYLVHKQGEVKGLNKFILYLCYVIVLSYSHSIDRFSTLIF
jgi:hypothetical protein